MERHRDGGRHGHPRHRRYHGTTRQARTSGTVARHGYARGWSARNGRTVERPRRCGLHSDRIPNTDEHVVYALVGACHDQRPAQRDRRRPPHIAQQGSHRHQSRCSRQGCGAHRERADAAGVRETARRRFARRGYTQSVGRSTARKPQLLNRRAQRQVHRARRLAAPRHRQACQQMEGHCGCARDKGFCVTLTESQENKSTLTIRKRQSYIAGLLLEEWQKQIMGPTN